ncbi:hypothetical protein GGI17_002382 [Coemansia sp. S146]|nr:hypothetical protein GGI17_002382 [Coemansia sp. S146]
MTWLFQNTPQVRDKAVGALPTKPPASNQTKESLLPQDDTKLTARRNRIVDAIKPYMLEGTYERVLHMLMLADKFKSFDKPNPALFKSLATNAPAFVDNKMTLLVVSAQVSRKKPSGTAELKCIGVIGEKAVTDYFMELIRLMKDAVHNHNESLGARSSKKIPACPYLLHDHQTAAIKDSKGHKADLGEIYELLEKSGINNISKVYESGILARDQFGYRLEYPVLEHRRCSIEGYLMPMVGEPRTADVAYVKVRNIVSCTLRCLAQAYARCGILQRDVSMGNVLAGLDGSVKVIDWGYGKLPPATGLSRDAIAHRKLVTTKWGFDDNLAGTVHNPLTGTPLYTSVPILCGAIARGPIDEIESLFYVILHALSALENSPGSVICGFTYHDNDTFAMVRIGCLARESLFLRFFGVTKGSRELHQLLYKLREYLFVDNGVYIAPDLALDPYTPRGNNPELLSDYIDTETMDVLQMIKSA